MPAGRPVALCKEVDAMRILAIRNGLNQRDGTEAAQRYARLAMILSLSILGVASAYLGALYLIAH